MGKPEELVFSNNETRSAPMGVLPGWE